MFCNENELHSILTMQFQILSPLTEIAPFMPKLQWAKFTVSKAVPLFETYHGILIFAPRFRNNAHSSMWYGDVVQLGWHIGQ